MELLNSALKNHQAGRWPEAERQYRQVLATEPRNADALHLLGLLYHQTGKVEQAIALYKQAIEIRPNYLEAYGNLAMAFQRQGKVTEAIAHFQQVLATEPNHADTHLRLAVALHQEKQYDGAITHYQRAIALQPANPSAYNNLAVVLQEQGKYELSLTHVRQAIAQEPKYVEAHYNLGNILRTMGKYEEAVGAYKQAIALKPNYPEAYYNLGNTLGTLENWWSAIESYQKAIALKPNYVKAHNNLGTVLRKQGNLERALISYQKAIALKPNYSDAYYNMGILFGEQDKFDSAIKYYQQAIALNPDPEIYNNLAVTFFKQRKITEAIASYRRAIELRPNYAEAHKNLGMALLLLGEMQQGLAELEWRWQCGTFTKEKSAYDFGKPLWDGGDLAGRTILLYSEQGMGDAIQFIRYVPLVKAKGAQVIVECQKPLLRLFTAVPEIDRVVERGTELPEFDVQASLMTLPHILGTTLDNIPARVPYLPRGTGETPVLGMENKIKVGIVWGTKSSHPTAKDRSCKLSDFLPILEIKDITFYSLQKGEQVAEIASLGQDNLVNLDEQLQDFADTAAVMQELDLIITVDTAVCHLAGALGKPAWVLLPFVPDWRWMLDKSDTPWYPTMRLFRQEKAKDWSQVFVSVREALELWISQQSGSEASKTLFNEDVRELMDEALLPDPDPHPKEWGYKNEARLRGLSGDQQQLMDRALLAYEEGNLTAAVQLCREIIGEKPENSEALHLMGAIAHQNGNLDESVDYFQQSLKLKPDYTEAHCNLAMVLKQQGKLTEAIGHYRQAIGIQPDYAEAHYNLGMALLLSGDMENGFREYEWRWQWGEFAQQNSPSIDRPLWDGTTLQGRTILLHAEQGYGDSIQFIRYVSLVRERGGKAIVACPQELKRLFTTVPGIAEVLTTGDPLPEFDCYAPLMSLPHILGTTTDTIPNQVPYLDPEALKRLLQTEARTGESQVKVGITWACKHTHWTYSQRSCQLDQFLPLLEFPGITWYSLQKGPHVADLQLVDGKIINLDEQLQDFADTAGAIGQLDLVITVDTAVAHLAGAMAKPVWLLLPFVPNWRWLLDNSDSPWYPTMRLFRQQEPGDWRSVFAKVASALKGLPKPRTTDTMVKPASPADKIKGLAIGWSVGSPTGWGVYGLNLALQLGQKPGFELLLLSSPALSNLVNPLHQVLLRPLMANQQQIQTVINQNPGKQIAFNVPVLHALGNNFGAGKANLVGKPTVGMIFFENTLLTPDAIARARSYDLIVAGSTWNAEVLKSNGLNHVAAIFQGIDPTIFHPAPKSNLFADRFVVFSGGKLEYRKGQDIAIAAFKRFQQRHPEALLLTAWHNFWPQFMAGLEQTGNVVGLPQVTTDKRLRITEWLVANGIPPEAIIDIGPIPNHLVGQIIREADVALFTNRCEGGTNLAAMECLACGIPTIISGNTGHKDIIAENHCYPLKKQGYVQATAIFPGVEGWGESDVEEVVENLEQVYRDRQAAKTRGQAAVAFMQDLTWKKQVDSLLRVLADVVSTTPSRSGT
ncbi:MAG: tetratricopeptide repeat protein [Hormoscilla sp.]